MDKPTISILGCGWIGLPLAQKLVEEGFTVKGSTTKEDKGKLLEDAGIETHVLNLDPQLQGSTWSSFFKSDILLINIPPQVSKGKDFHILQLENLFSMIKKSPIQKIIYISSTSVYPNLSGNFEEKDSNIEIAFAKKDLSWQEVNYTLLEAEDLLQREWDKDWIILRMGGLMGDDRIPIKYSAGKTLNSGLYQSVNYVHRIDAISAVQKTITDGRSMDIYNVVAPIHPLRIEVLKDKRFKDVYAAPIFAEKEPAELLLRRISSQKLMGKLNFVFQYPDPLEFSYHYQGAV